MRRNWKRSENRLGWWAQNGSSAAVKANQEIFPAFQKKQREFDGDGIST